MASSPATPSPLSPFAKTKKRRGRGHAYGRMGMVGPFPQAPKVSGLDTAGALQWAKDNKWYLLGGSLLLAAAVALATSKH
jgi:hypothetical protein